MNFGFGEATLRYVAYHYGDRNLAGVNRVFGSTLSFYSVVCIVASAVLIGATPSVIAFLKIPAGEHRMVGWTLRLSALVFSLSNISRAFGAIPMALQRYDISSKINIGQSIMRSLGYILLVISNFGILHLVMWEVVTYFVTLCVQVKVIRKLIPGVRLLPSRSFRGLREIFGYSIYSLLTHGFLMLFRESGKLALGRYLGPSPIVYYGTPDNVAQRIHMLVVSGSETLLPRFSANRDPKVVQSLVLSGTWIALAFSIVFFVPLVVLMPDFLSLWISPKFSLESAAVGRLVAISYVMQGVFVPAATYFRGTGRPWVVSVVILLAGVGTLLSCMLLIPAHGVIGVGYAYLLGSIAHVLGLLCAWFYIFGASSMASLMRSIGLPLLLAGIAFTIESTVRGQFTDVSWVGLFALGGLFVGITAMLVLGADWVIGGDSTSKQIVERIGQSDKFRRLLT